MKKATREAYGITLAELGVLASMAFALYAGIIILGCIKEILFII